MRLLVAMTMVCTLSAAAWAEPVKLSLRDAASTPAAVSASASEWNYQAETATADATLSPQKAVLYSLLLPGLGDWKLGNKNRATVFFAIEGLIWVSYATFQVQGGNYEDEYESLAVRFAGVAGTDHSDDFYATIRDYDSSEEYEADIKNEGRYYDTGSEALDQYFIENRVDDYQPWLWASTDRRLQYSETRSASKTAYRRADYMIAAAAANRLVSAVFAYAAARSAAQHEVGLNLDVSPRGDVVLELTKKF
jgi:hypothetical protein